MHNLLFIALCLLSFPSQAHLLKIFATAQGEQIEGSVYFSGSDSAPTAKISIRSTQGKLLAELTSNKRGHFTYQTVSQMDHLLHADSGDGHTAKWTIRATELAGGSTTTPDEVTAQQHIETGEAAGRFSSAHFERAIARQIAPLRRQLVSLEERIKFQDMLGGIGYIIGLAGLAAWYHSRKKDRL